MRAYFVEGRHVGRTDDLAQLAAEVGLDPAEVTRALEEDRYLEAVHTDQAHAVRLGISGVPFFVIDDRYGISGAQKPEVFVDAIRRVVADRGGHEVVAS